MNSKVRTIPTNSGADRGPIFTPSSNVSLDRFSTVVGGER